MIDHTDPSKDANKPAKIATGYQKDVDLEVQLLEITQDRDRLVETVVALYSKIRKLKKLVHKLNERLTR